MSLSAFKWKTGRHPTSLTMKALKGGLFETHSFPLTMAGLGGGLVRRRTNVDTFLRWRAASSPHLTRYFSGEHIRLSPIFFICDFIDKDTNIFELWAVVLQRQTMLYLCVLCGPHSCGQCDLFSVILWTTGRWQLKNEPLKTRCSEAAQCLAY